MSVPYTITNKNISMVVDGGVRTIGKDAVNFELVRNILLSEQWDKLQEVLTMDGVLSTWSNGDFRLVNGKIQMKGVDLPQEMSDRVIQMVKAGEDPAYVLRFWEKLQKNPSRRSVSQLWGFLNHQGIPLAADGDILAYKAVRPDFLDIYSGMFLNTVGAIHEMNRNAVSDDPQVPCHEGYHVGALPYALSFGGPESKIVICKVDPADVVCVPYDESFMKMRVCRYEVIGHYAVQMPSTVFLYQKEIEELEDEIEEEEEDEIEEEIEAQVPEAPKPVETKRPKKWAKWDNMEEIDLLKCSTIDLRKYATHGLKIIGVSKMPGGKLALVAKILEVR